MAENNTCASPSADDVRGVKGFFRDLLFGVLIGVAFIIPGFSGGSVAAILGIYGRLVNAIAGLGREFKKNALTLLPIALGLVLGAVSLMLPLGYLLGRFPLHTVSVFVGLAIGGIPSMLGRVKGKPTANDLTALSLPLVLALLLCFIPAGADVDLFGIGFFGYVMLFFIGMLGSSALVVPGISGSMLLLILGYYRPLIALFSDHLLRLSDVGHSVLVLAVCGLGMLAGFFTVSVVMKHLLAKYPRGTFYAILGFIIGSLPAVYVSTMKDAGMISDRFEAISLPQSPVYYAMCVFLVFIGICASYFLSALADREE